MRHLQVRNLRKKEKAKGRISADEFVNTHLLSHHLIISGVKFVRFYASVPQTVVYLISEDLLEEARRSVEALGTDRPLVFHYDTCFGLGKFYVSTLSLRHPLFQ